MLTRMPWVSQNRTFSAPTPQVCLPSRQWQWSCPSKSEPTNPREQKISTSRLDGFGLTLVRPTCVPVRHLLDDGLDAGWLVGAKAGLELLRDPGPELGGVSPYMSDTSLSSWALRSSTFAANSCAFSGHTARSRCTRENTFTPCFVATNASSSLRARPAMVRMK